MKKVYIGKSKILLLFLIFIIIVVSAIIFGYGSNYDNDTSEQEVVY